MTNDALRDAIETIVYDALLAENTAAYSDEPSRAPSCADVTTKIMAAIEADTVAAFADVDNYTSESETAAILADSDTMVAIAEGEVTDEMAMNYNDDGTPFVETYD